MTKFFIYDSVKTVVESIKSKIVRTLPILWNKWKYARDESVLYTHGKACLQMDKQKKPKEKL